MAAMFLECVCELGGEALRAAVADQEKRWKVGRRARPTASMQAAAALQ